MKELGCFYAEEHIAAGVDCGMHRFFVGDESGRVYFPELVEG